MGQAIARADHEAIESVIRMQLDGARRLLAIGLARWNLVNGKFYADKVAGYVLGGLCECGRAIVAQELQRRLIRATNKEQPSIKPHNS